MRQPHKPEGYPDVSAYLIVDDAEAALAFMVAAFDAEHLRVMRRNTGEIMHAEAQIGDSVVMVGQMPGGPNAHMHLYLSDPQAAFDRAIAAGAEAVQELEVKDDGERRGGVRDTNGTTWWIASAAG
ncbi:VOC family protein [Roseovarius pelagicus]|uniref:VOC family protein n=1 Tax=Roseovarius pelagicus TaxID=2980108 RepID=A0ABY6DEB7_9RHOB|nr:VOC family protein [Roseovarius pelagicus]UXX84481.1 VOC family protein [Roseovarius pelagicus]